MKAFIEILREKYGLAQPEAEKLLEQMELLTYRNNFGMSILPKSILSFMSFLCF
jgi:hypothetical protein